MFLTVCYQLQITLFIIMVTVLNGCINYPFPPCEHTSVKSSKPRCKNNRPTPQCKRTCDSDQLNYLNEMTDGKSVYHLDREEQIKADILENGPVAAGFIVHEDFVTYKSGIYFNVKGKLIGSHAVKIIGWGVENDEPYWLIANSWNDGWGDHGFFKMIRGRNECGIEDRIYAGLPLIRS